MKLHKVNHIVYKTKISYCLNKPILKKGFSNKGKKLSENKIQEILSIPGIYRDRNKERSCSTIYDNSAEICNK